jgi:hypothetical protein
LRHAVAKELPRAKLVKAEWGVCASNRRVTTYQITSGLSNLEQPVSSFERMFEGVTLAFNPAKS